jgi:hypothetical protein
MPCPYLEYLQRDEDHEFDHERPWCAAQSSFVSPMRADICNDRFEFDHECDCQVYERATGEERQLPVDSVD